MLLMLNRARLTRVVVLFTGALMAAPALAAPMALSNLAQLNRHAKVSAYVMKLADRSTIAELNGAQRLRPASSSKLFAASAALQQFGPEHRFTSRFTSQAPISGNTLRGDLVFVGGGDPALDTPALRTLVARLSGRGIQTVAGDLVIDDGLFGPVPCLTQDRCAAQRRSSHAYSAPLSAAGVNFGTVNVTLYPGDAPGGPSRVVLQPAGLPGYQIDNRVDTVARGGSAGVSAWRTYEAGVSTLHLRGKLPVGYGAYDFQRGVTGPAEETAKMLSTLLSEAGIRVTGRVRTQSSDYDSHGALLAEIQSDTLAEQLIPMLAYSNNYMADTLTLDVAADSGYNLPLTLPRASQALEALADRADAFTFGSAGNGSSAAFTSGSGLSLENDISARDLVALLDYMYHQDALFPAFYGAIPVPLSAPSRTLKQGNFDFQTRIVAKTGTLSEPVTVRALAGYMRLSDGGFAAFGILINGTDDDPALSYQQTVTAYQKDLEAILAAY
tara:strand:+ start:5675 stop:7168 length:1494 start_codon:yes stop_codon:yes gene_type:complete